MRKCVRCGKKGLFLELDIQEHCANCRSIIKLETKVPTVEKKVAAAEEKIKELEQKTVDLEKCILDLNLQMNTVKFELEKYKEMYNPIIVRTGDVDALALEFVQMDNQGLTKFKIERLENPDILLEHNILAIHFADGGAQGDPGAVFILYRSQRGLQILYGNHAYGNLNLSALIEKIPMLEGLNLPEEWGYMYMGVMNHFFARKSIPDVDAFINALLNQGGKRWLIFFAVAWFCGAKCN